LLPLLPFCIIADLDDVTVKYNEKYMTIRRNLHTYNMVTLPYGFQPIVLVAAGETMAEVEISRHMVKMN